MLGEKGTGTFCFGGETESRRMEERAVTCILWVSGRLRRTQVFSVWGADRGHQWSWGRGASGTRAGLLAPVRHGFLESGAGD